MVHCVRVVVGGGGWCSYRSLVQQQGNATNDYEDFASTATCHYHAEAETGAPRARRSCAPAPGAWAGKKQPPAPAPSSPTQQAGKGKGARRKALLRGATNTVALPQPAKPQRLQNGSSQAEKAMQVEGRNTMPLNDPPARAQPKPRTTL